MAFLWYGFIECINDTTKTISYIGDSKVLKMFKWLLNALQSLNVFPKLFMLNRPLNG